MSYPIAEYFDSIQGEGLFCGERMFFLRLAGCPVGLYLKPEEAARRPSDYGELAILRSQNPEYSVCASVFGQRFLCDTNYAKPVIKLDAEDLVPFVEAQAPGCRTLCLTGGEPFSHRLMPLISAATSAGLNIHIETSGAVAIPPEISSLTWITCSPKTGFIAGNRLLVHEWKFLLAANMGLSPAAVASRILSVIGCEAEALVAQGQAVSLQAIGTIEGVDQENIRFCLEVQKELPQDAEVYVRPQLHKFMGLR